MTTNFKNKVIYSIRRINIQNRLLIIFLSLSLIPVLFIGIYAYNIYTNSINDKLSSSAQQTVGLLNATIATELERYAFYINSLSISDSVQQLLLAAPSEDFVIDVQDVISIRNKITDTTIQPIYLKNIRIADINGKVLYDLGFDEVDSHQYLETLRYIDNSSPKDSLSYVRTFRSVDNLVLGRKIYSYPGATEHIGYILIYINEILLSDVIYPDISYGEGSDIMLIDRRGTVISSKNQDYLGINIQEEQIYQQMITAHTSGEKSFDTVFRDETVHTVFSYSQQYDSFFVTTITRDYIANETRAITKNLIIAAALLIILSFAATMLIYISIMQPIKTILSRCRVVSEDSKEEGINDKSPDELGFLARTIDQNFAQLKRMAHQWRQDQKRKRELELESLQYQINPHFLFNTLNTLKWIAVMNDVPILEEGITSLSNLLQNTILHKDDEISIKDELSNLDHYFTIQKIRYADSFNVIFEINESLLENKVPRLILQPLAENAIIHGTQNGNFKVDIFVRCKDHSSDSLILEVCDNGIGFDQNLPQNKNFKKDTTEKFSGIGLKNVSERLKLYFGENYGLTITSKINHGTDCRIIIPKKTK